VEETEHQTQICVRCFLANKRNRHRHFATASFPLAFR
jgi:hypothetical protein